MIRIFEWNANHPEGYYDDVNARYLTNGIGTLSPTKCTVSETLNGEYELVMEHPFDEIGKWKRIELNRIVVAPVPRSPHPIMYTASGSQFRRLADIDGPKHLLASPRLDANEYSSSYEPGTEFKILAESTYAGPIEYNSGSYLKVSDAEPGWAYVTPPLNGTSGYIQTRYLRYSRTRLTGVHYDDGYDSDAATDIIVPSLEEDSTRYTIKDQAFRIYKIERRIDSVVAYARHIFYDYGESYVPYCDVGAYLYGRDDDGLNEDYSIVNAPELALTYIAGSSSNYLQESCVNNGVHIRMNVRGSKYEKDWIIQKKTLTDIILGSDGFVERYGGEVMRDNNVIYWHISIGQHRGVYVKSGKNLTGITFTEDWSEAVNRIMPIGKNDDGDNLFLNGRTGEVHSTSVNLYVTKDDIASVPFYRTAVLNDEMCNTVEKLRKSAEAEFEKGCDQPKITVSLQFELLGESEEYAQYHKLQGIFLGDTVYAKSSMANIDVPVKMTQYTYNCLTMKYESMTLGTPEKIDLKV